VLRASLAHPAPRYLASACCNFSGSDNFLLTQIDLAGMVGSTRSSISTAASTLANAGAIEYRRGHIHVLRSDVLRNYACECHKRLAVPIDEGLGSFASSSI
jgi:hypothetical protein